ncbi:MAG: cyclic nucleotide-binding domain-containing protein [Magnetococcales bacterium]|nr:cyclic nucleotide-binding domain-containing protein [Magnetococcales bacterium]
MGALLKPDRQLGRKYMSGEVIFSEGEPADSMYFIQEGRVGIQFPGLYAGNQELMLLEKGQIFGEASLFGTNRTRCATARALENSSIIKVDEKIFITRLHQDPSLAFNVLKSMAGKIRLLGEGQLPEFPVDDSLPLLADSTKRSELPYESLIDKVIQPNIARSSFKILMIEDDPLFQTLAQTWLAPSVSSDSLLPADPVFILNQTDSLGKAIEIMKSGKIDLIVLDLNLPDSSGLNTISRLMRKAGNTPIVVFSGTDDEEQILLAARHGAEDYLIKGQVSKIQFIRSIRSALERHHVGEESLKLSSLVDSNHDAATKQGAKSLSTPWYHRITKHPMKFKM